MLICSMSVSADGFIEDREGEGGARVTPGPQAHAIDTRPPRGEGAMRWHDKQPPGEAARRPVAGTGSAGRPSTSTQRHGSRGASCTSRVARRAGL